jgi:hypothetical protein
MAQLLGYKQQAQVLALSSMSEQPRGQGKMAMIKGPV